MSQFCSIGFRKWRGPRSARLGGRGAVALEFAILAIPFFMWILFIFEMSYDLFTQEALDYAVHAAVRQIQTGNAQSLSTGAAFIGSDICGAAKGLLECPNIWVKVAAVTAPEFAPPTTNGALPMFGHHLDLGQYTNSSGAHTGSAEPNPPPYCIAGAKQPVLVSVVYVGPTFIGALLPNVLSATFQGATVHATLATAGFVTEPFIPTNPQGGTGSSGGTGSKPAGPC